MVSKRKLETNRQNAILSIGPSNTAATRWNALTHGILSKEVLITVGDGQEDAETFEEFANPLRENLSPVGALEELLVDQLTILTWRWRRVLKYEAAAIRQKSDTGIEDWDRQQYKNRLDYPALYGRWRWESQTDLFAGAASLKLDLEALDTEDPIAIRPDICVQVFNVAREQFGVPIHEILGFKMLLDNHGFSKKESQQVIDPACQRQTSPGRNSGKQWKERSASNVRKRLPGVNSASGK